jgi:hypothetical protein
VAFGKLVKINHPAPGDGIRNPEHVAGYGTAFEGMIPLRMRDDGRVIAEGSTQGGSNGVVGEFKSNLAFQHQPNQRLGVVEVFEQSASESGEDLHLFGVPIVFGQQGKRWLGRSGVAPVNVVVSGFKRRRTRPNVSYRRWSYNDVNRGSGVDLLCLARLAGRKNKSGGPLL